jgi:hypothetical protein
MMQTNLVVRARQQMREHAFGQTPPLRRAADERRLEALMRRVYDEASFLRVTKLDESWPSS